MSIVEFLLARIAEDEADAADIRSGHADYGATEFEPDETILRQTDPARILAECKAKRELIADLHDDGHPSYQSGERLKIIAAIYSNHPDYQQVWR